LDLLTALHYYRARYYDAGLERFVNRDPTGYKAGDVNLYRYVGNNATTWRDPLGLYPGTEGHGSIISPEASVELVRNLQQLGNLSFDMIISNYWFKHDPSVFRNLYRLATIAFNIGTWDNNKFVYTCAYGWIDMGHFFNNAALTYASTRKVSIVASEVVELVQKLEGSNSAYTPEDLVSNQLGRDMGNMLFYNDAKGIALYQTVSINPLAAIPENVFDNIAWHWMRLLKSAGAVEWNARTLPLLVLDLATFQMNPRHDIFTVEASRRYYESTVTWNCLCDGDKPRFPADRY
jgi:RHS repeat-associated protein